MSNSLNEQPQLLDEDYGKIKMDKFKSLCREILGEKKKVKTSSSKTKVVHSADNKDYD